MDFGILGKAHSLFEMMVVVGVIAILAAMTAPMMGRLVNDSLFYALASELTSHLEMARGTALTTERSIAMDFAESSKHRFACTYNDGENKGMAISINKWTGGYQDSIRNRLPSKGLPHPSGRGGLTSAIRSTHKPKVIFGPDGASAATLVFSDEDDRALCVVVTPNTGRFRVWIKLRESDEWRIFY